MNLLTTDEAAERLNVSERTLHQRKIDFVLKAVKR